MRGAVGISRVAIVDVGDELLAGMHPDTNATMFARMIAGVGARVVRCYVVSDDVDEIVGALRSAQGCAEGVILCGGLGPTRDDITRDAFAMLCGVELERRQELVHQLRNMFAPREMPESNLRQADIPVGATTIENPLGSAFGIRAEVDDVVFWAIPGVPREAEQMVRDYVVPELAGDDAVFDVFVAGRRESELADRLADITNPDGSAIGYYPGDREMRLRFKVPRSALNQHRSRVEHELGERLKEDFLGSVNLLDTLVQLLARAQQTVAVVESCTTGMVMARLGDVRGSSEWFKGGQVLYNERAKIELGGVSARLIETNGTVDEDVAKDLAEDARVKFHADWGVAITGVAGPTSHSGKPVGTVVCAVAWHCGAAARTFSIPGDREWVRRRATSATLDFLRRTMMSVAAEA